MSHAHAPAPAQSSSDPRGIGLSYRRGAKPAPPSNPTITYDNLGELMLDVAKAGGGHGFAGTDDGARYCRTMQSWAKALPTGMNETVGGDGGVLVAPQLADEVLQSVYRDPVLSRCSTYTPARGQLQVPGVHETSRVNGARAGGISSSWRSEGSESVASKPAFDMVSLALDTLDVYVRLSNELVEDSALVGSALSRIAGDELRFRLVERIVRGRGVWRGLIDAPSLISIAKEAGQAAATINYTNVAKMLQALHPACWAGAVWLHEPRCVQQLLNMTVPNGRAGYNPGPPDRATLLGFPCLPCEQSLPLGTLGDLLLVDLTTLVVAMRGGTAQSLHLHWLSNEQVWRFQVRFDSASHFLSAVTTYNGDLASNIVGLATRS